MKWFGPYVLNRHAMKYLLNERQYKLLKLAKDKKGLWFVLVIGNETFHTTKFLDEQIITWEAL